VEEKKEDKQLSLERALFSSYLVYIIRKNLIATHSTVRVWSGRSLCSDRVVGKKLCSDQVVRSYSKKL
jgi:hypothetical protein